MIPGSVFGEQHTTCRPARLVPQSTAAVEAAGLAGRLTGRAAAAAPVRRRLKCFWLPDLSPVFASTKRASTKAAIACAAVSCSRPRLTSGAFFIWWSFFLVTVAKPPPPDTGEASSCLISTQPGDIAEDANDSTDTHRDYSYQSVNVSLLYGGRAACRGTGAASPTGRAEWGEAKPVG